MSCSNVDNFSPSEAYLLPKESIPPMKMMWTEEEKIKKEIKKRDKHNTIEQRRRENINNRIKELGTLLPPTIHPKLKTCKGSILKASVDYIKELQKSRETLIEVESNIKAMKARNQKMLMKIFQLELKIKLYKLTCDG
ncbi:transcription factor EC-like [Saccostrea cucullata]|uniref:transcription factor EC-like n=1 Tax=Saccostrea cuccullata TaxID=36930 RepID=UPI002ED69958